MKYLFRYRAAFIGLFVVLAGASVYQTLQLRFNHNLEAFFPEGDPELAFFSRFREKLSAGDNFLLVGLENRPSVFQPHFLKRIDSLETSLNQLERVIRTESVVSAQRLIKTPFGYNRFPYLHPDQPERLTKDSAQLMQSPLYGERLLSRQGDATLLLVRIEDVAREQNAKNFVDQFQEVLAQHGFQDAHLGGRVYTQVRFIDMIQQELAFYIVISNLVLLVVLVWVFRTFWGVVIPLGTVLLGLLLFLGFLGWYGRPLDLMSVLFPILMLIIGMSDVIHILSKYRDELEEGRERQEAMVLALKEIGLATLLTSMTTSIGFLSLLTSRLEPIRMFGVLASVGVMIAYLTVIGFTAPLLTYFSHRQLGAAAKRSAGWNRLSEYIYLTCRRRPRTIVAVSVVVVIASVLGMRQVGTNTYLMGDIPDDSELETDFHWFEKHFSGVRDFELAILPQKGRTVMDTAVLRRTDRMVAYLEDSLPIFPKLISPLTPVRILHQAREGGAPKAYRLPEQAGEWQAILRELNRLRPLMEYLVSKDGRMGRISGRVRDLGSDSMSVVRNQVRQWSAAHIDTNVVQFRPTGAAMIIDRNNRYLTESLFKGLGIAFAIISGLMMLLFRDARMLAISLVPNVLPLLMAGGFIGFIDIELKASTAIIFTIAFGIAVDDTIHFLTRYRLLRESGYALYPSLRMTLHESGKAIVLTSILLLAGFLTLSMSDFKATYYVGILISVTVVGALLADLLLLPVILQWVYRKADRKQANARAKPRTQALSPNQKSLPSS